MSLYTTNYTVADKYLIFVVRVTLSSILLFQTMCEQQHCAQPHVSRGVAGYSSGMSLRDLVEKSSITNEFFEKSDVEVTFRQIRQVMVNVTSRNRHNLGITK